MSQRTLPRALLRPLICSCLLALSNSGPRTARAAAPSVSLGEVVIVRDNVGPAPTPELTRILRDALLEELTRLSSQAGFAGRPLVVSATLTRLSIEQGAQQTKATAAISLALRGADDQVLFAELLGKASAEETRGSLASIRRAALRGAVRGAAARLPEAMRRSR